MLTHKQRETVFNLEEVRIGDFLYARHSSWDEGRNGLVAGISKDRMKVQFIPAIGNVTNYFHIPSDEVEDSWVVRWSHDLTVVDTTEDGSD